MATCKSCGATIEFQSTETGKMMPVETGIAQILTKDGQIVRGKTPHWDKCPGADKHRKPKNTRGKR